MSRDGLKYLFFAPGSLHLGPCTDRIEAVNSHNMDESESPIWVLPFSSLGLQSDSKLGAALLIKVTKDPSSTPPCTPCFQQPVRQGRDCTSHAVLPLYFVFTPLGSPQMFILHGFPLNTILRGHRLLNFTIYNMVCLLNFTIYNISGTSGHHIPLGNDLNMNSTNSKANCKCSMIPPLL